MAATQGAALVAGRPLTGRRPWTLAVLELLTALSAVYGGIGLIGEFIGMPDSWLRGMPFSSWVLPGVFLVLVVAVPVGTAALLELRHSAWAPAASVVVGAAPIGWIGAELLLMQKYDVLQPVMLGVGLAVLLLSLWADRARPVLPASPSSRRRRTTP